MDSLGQEGNKAAFPLSAPRQRRVMISSLSPACKATGFPRRRTCRASSRQKNKGRYLGQPQPTHLPEQFSRVSLKKCCYFLHFLALKNQMHSSPQVLSCQDVAVGALECTQEQGAESPPGCALMAQLPLCASVSSGLRARFWPEHELCQLLLPAVPCRQYLPAQTRCQVALRELLLEKQVPPAWQGSNAEQEQPCAGSSGTAPPPPKH